jgi:hypothetical protein
MIERDEAAVREQAFQDAAADRVIALAEELGVPVQRAYVDGPPPLWPVTVLVYTAHAGLGPGDDTRQFRQRFEIRERDAVREMPDGLLVELVTRLRRQLVMATEDGLTDWALEWTRQRFEDASRELSWRRRAVPQGGDDIDRRTAWRDRVEAVKQSVDLAMLIAYECGGKPVGAGKWQCRCPFHADASPSLSIDVAKGLWNCHGCNVGGDCFTYVEMRYGLDFAAAVRHLEQRL